MLEGVIRLLTGKILMKGVEALKLIGDSAILHGKGISVYAVEYTLRQAFTT
jgi:hypothetical protein